MNGKDILSGKDDAACRRTDTASAKSASARAPKETYLMHCRGPLADGSCRMPEDTCNHPTCPARG